MADSTDRRATLQSCIEGAALSRATALNLNSRAWTELPPDIEKLTHLIELNLGDNELTSLPSEIGKLTNLTRLDLHGNELGSLPPEIGKLTKLTELSLSDNQLASLPPEIGKLTSLTRLDLYVNQLASLPPEIGKLTSLTTLHLYGNQLTSLPPEIGKLRNLTTLHVYDNRLTSLAPEIAKLTRLTWLNVSCNQLTSLPAEIGKLTNLTKLDLHTNQLTSLPAEIGKLTNLTRLDLFRNRLTSLPPKIGKLTNLTELYLQSNPALDIPPEILKATWEEVLAQKAKPASPQVILEYYFRTREPADQRALNEVKVILVGQGSVGKTSLVKRIVYGKFNKRERKTEGIYIEKSWKVPGRKKSELVQVNFWDFGGQEIMHATHQFFLTKRTLYLLVLDARKGENESNISYWLKIISSYGGDSPIIIVLNKCEQHVLELNETRLRKDYPQIRAILETSCEKNTGIKELKKAIQREVLGMRHVFDPLPKEYFAVKGAVEALAAERNQIPTREYYGLCQQHGINDLEEQDRVLRFLHDLGSVLSFNDPENPYALRETSVLNPEWVTQGVYQILNEQNAKRCDGVLKKRDLGRILDTEAYPGSCRRFIIDMMYRFELCFAVTEHEVWLVPELLRENEPEGMDAPEDALRLEYHYDVLPAGVICRFIVRRYENLGNPPVCWRSGAVLRFDGCTAVVRSDKDKGRMFIAVTGPERRRRGFLALLRQEFTSIHGTIPNLRPDERVPLPDQPELSVSYGHLLRMEGEGRKDHWPEGAKRNYTIAELLDGIEDQLIRGWNRFGYLMLRPPFFAVEPETNFPDAWEVFCCSVLNRYYRTDSIRQRKPPEGGIDLYWPEKKVAYQCKSVELGGQFSLTKAMASIDTALETRKDLPWEKYVLCSNVVLTGDQERKLHEKLQEGELELLTPSFWQPRCLEQREHLQERFNVLARTDEYGRLVPM
jgi:internalin A